MEQDILDSPVYLYIKTHQVTGLKYFGKTTYDPFRYKGSGKRWLNHLRVHGNFVNTEVYGTYYDEVLLTKAALLFSQVNNIVESDEWANLIPENGITGQVRGAKLHTKESRAKLSQFMKEAWADEATRSHRIAAIHATTENEDFRSRVREGMKGHVRSDEHNQKLAELARTRKSNRVPKDVKVVSVKDKIYESQGFIIAKHQNKWTIEIEGLFFRSLTDAVSWTTMTVHERSALPASFFRDSVVEVWARRTLAMLPPGVTLEETDVFAYNGKRIERGRKPGMSYGWYVDGVPFRTLREVKKKLEESEITSLIANSSL